jgi:ABC-type nitrate/sulfonate/bicarbonate transport system permease component
MRPFFGTPFIEIAFLRPHPFDGTFYETVWRSLQKITNGNALAIVLVLVLTIVLLLLPVMRKLSSSRSHHPPLT